MRSMVEGAHIATGRLDGEAGPLHRPAVPAGPPPRSGEDL
jgi:hypothetical protein